MVDSQRANVGQWHGSPWNALNIEYFDDATNPEDKVAAHSFWELHDEVSLLRRSDGQADNADAGGSSSARGGGGGGGGGGGRNIDPETPCLDLATTQMLTARVRAAMANPEYDPFLETIGTDASFPQCDGTDVNYCSMVPLAMALDTVLP